MSEKTIQALALFFKKYNNEAIVESFYCYILDKKNDFSSPEVQSYILKNWWTSNFSSFSDNNEKHLTQKENSLFFKILSWDQLIKISDDNQFGNNDEHDAIYRGQNMSWFQYGLLDHWTLIKEASLYANPKKFSKSISLTNSLEENSWHFLARTLKKSRRIDFMEIVEMIQKFSTISVLQKNIMGQTSIDILKENIEYQLSEKLNANLKFTEINQQVLEIFEKISLHEKLTHSLVDLPCKSKFSRKI